MRRSLSLLLAGALAVSLTAESMIPAQAAPRPAPIATDSADVIIKVAENFHGDRHNAFRDDGWNDNWRWKKKRWRQSRWDRDDWRPRRHRHGFSQFQYGFPFAFVQPYRRHNRGNDCFRTWDGQLICRGY